MPDRQVGSETNNIAFIRKDNHAIVCYINFSNFRMYLYN